jgi:hypothetical protein
LVFAEGFLPPLMVGDYDGTNSSSPSVQFIAWSDERRILLSPDEALSLEKVDPVTFAGFVAVPVAYDTREPRPGANVTVVGYGATTSWDVNNEAGHDPAYPGAAVEVPLQVLEVDFCAQAYLDSGLSEATVFCAAAPETDPPYGFRAAGPCYGTDVCCVSLRLVDRAFT